jgi:peroxidase
MSILTQSGYECFDGSMIGDGRNLASTWGSMQSGGPYWRVLLGRRDSTTASYSAANENLPSPNADLPTLIAKFQSQGLSVDDMVTLSGEEIAKCP